MVFRVLEIAGAILSGRFLDRHRTNTTNNTGSGSGGMATSSSPPQTIAIQFLCIFLAVNSTGNLIAILEEFDAATGSDDAATETTTSAATVTVDVVADPWPVFLRPTLAFVCWGFADSQIQVR